MILGAFEIAIFGALAIWMLISNAGDLNLQPFNPNHAVGDWSGVFKGMVFAILAFIGFEAAAPLGEEAKNPQTHGPARRRRLGDRDRPLLRALLVRVGVRRRLRQLRRRRRPARIRGATSARSSGARGWILVFLAICNSIAANSNAAVNAATRVFYALARNGLAPRPLGTHAPRVQDAERRDHLDDDLRGRARSLLLGWKWGPLIGFAMIATLAVARGDRRLHAGRIGLHLVLPGTEAAQPVQRAPAPDRPDRRDRCSSSSRSTTSSTRCPPTYPIKYANWVALGVDRCSESCSRSGLVRRRPDRLTDMDRVYVEDETLAPDAAPAVIPSVMAVAAAHRDRATRSSGRSGPTSSPCSRSSRATRSRFETNDCFTGQIRSEDDLVTEIDLERINSATGPVAVEGAEPGDSLVAEILDVRPIEWASRR